LKVEEETGADEIPGAKVGVLSPEGQAPAADGAPRGTLTRRRSLGHAAAFGETSNPADYVPREATERALSKLELCAWKGRSAALIGQPGLGKTLLLRLLVQRMEPKVRCVFLPYASLELSELCRWVLGLLGEIADDEPEPALSALARALAREGSALLLLVDDAGGMPVETARGLGRAVARSEGSLRVVLAATDDAGASRVAAALHPDTVEVRLHAVMTLVETRAYLQGRLQRADVPPVAMAHFDPDHIERIHRLAGGVPRRVHELAGELLSELPRSVVARSGDDGWLGEPIGDRDETLAGEPHSGDADDPDEDLELPEDPPEAGSTARREDLGFLQRLLRDEP
jgi:type II secretory pathway predicted ATPase ExeA